MTLLTFFHVRLEIKKGLFLSQIVSFPKNLKYLQEFMYCRDLFTSLTLCLKRDFPISMLKGLSHP